MPESLTWGIEWYVPVICLLVSGHLTNISTTVFLHRAATHRGLELHPAVALGMRAWLWLTTGIVTREWVALHRKHHAHADREGDPHSPVLEGLANIVLLGFLFYHKGVQEPGLVEKYGKGTPDDWIERNVFARYSWHGLILLGLIDVAFLGPLWGGLLWIAQAFWMPFLGGVVNGIGHAWGYRNYDVKDSSTNFFPFGLLMGGEELHNNHHADPRSARFRRRWFEFDVGWIYIRLLSAVGLARVEHAGR